MTRIICQYWSTVQKEVSLSNAVQVFSQFMRMNQFDFFAQLFLPNMDVTSGSTSTCHPAEGKGINIILATIELAS